MNNLTIRVEDVYKATYPWVFWDDWFTEEELVAIEKYCDQHETEVSKTAGEILHPIRKSKSKHHYCNDENEWIFRRLFALAERVNSDFYRYDLTGFDSFQYTVYSNTGDTYGFHQDMIMGNKFPNDMNVLPRKLSFSLLLSDENEFEGGEFEFLFGDKDVDGVKDTRRVAQKRGRAIAFPSWMLHQVAPIKSGVRKSLVFWVIGPKFK